MINRFKSPRAVDVAGLGACVACGIAAVVFGVLPQIASVREAEETRAKRVQLRSDLNKAVARSNAFQNRLLDAERRVESGVEFRSTAEVNRVLAELTALARDTGCNARAQASPSTGEEGLLVTPIRMSGEGTPDAIDEFLGALRDERLDTRTVGVEVLRNAGRSGSLRFNVDLRWFALPDEIADGADRNSSAGSNAADG